jgi:hypothetical protein
MMGLGAKPKMSNVYVRLLNEGVEVYRPVVASRVSTTTYILGGADLCDPEDEEWEFPPGSLVNVQERILNGDVVLVAMSTTY